MFFFIPASPVYPKIGFSKKGFCQETFEKGLEKNKKLFVQKIDPKIYLKKSGAKIQPKSQAKSYKKSIQISKQRGAASGAAQKRGRRAKARRPVFGLLF